MDALHSLTLLISLLCGAAGVGIRWRPRAAGAANGVGRLAVRVALVAWAALGLSVVVHFVWGHGPGTPDALPPLQFVRQHPAFVVAALMPLAACVPAPVSGRR